MQRAKHENPMWRMRPASVLPGTIESHLQEASFATAARRRMLLAVRDETDAMHDASVAAIRRQEELLRTHLTGLASVWSARLEQRIAQLVLMPRTDAPAELQFVAAFLLLRCARARWANRLASMAKGAEAAQVRCLLQEAIELAAPTPTPDVAGPPDGSFGPKRGDDAPANRLAAPNDGVLPRDEARRLAYFAPAILMRCTRVALRKQAPISQVQLNSFASQMGFVGQQAADDFALLRAALDDPACARAVLHALWLTGRAQAADVYLAFWQQARDAHLRSLAADGFELITGLCCDEEDGAKTGDDVAAAERKARLFNSRVLSRFAEPALFGRPRDTETLIDVAADLTLEKWHALLLLIAAKNRGRCIVAPHLFFDAQIEQLKHNALLCDRLLFVDPRSFDATEPMHARDRAALKGLG